MLITPDLSQAVEVNDDTTIPNGVYKVRVESGEVKQTQAGEQRISWKLSIFGAEGELTRFNNWKVYHSTMISGKGAGMLKQFYKACAGRDLTGSFELEELYGKEVQVTVVNKTNADGTVSKYPDVKGIKPLTH
jgi:hypothetical protein